MADPNNTPRPLSPAADERTPLLSAAGDESSTQQQDAEQTAPLPSSDAEALQRSSASARIFSFIKRITYISLASSMISLMLLLATYITSNLSHYGSYRWEFEDLMAQLGTCMVFSTILSVLNIGTLLHSSRNPPADSNLLYLTPRTTFLWLPVSLFIDLVLVIFIWGIAARLSGDDFLRSFCSSEINFPSEDCRRWLLALRILCGTSIFASAIVGLAHMILFVLRSLLAFRSGLWSRPIPWNLPFRGLTVQLTVKLLSPEGGQERGNGN